ncbi:inosine 5-monophosphate dehydrogenase [Firmicutes bacterium CAG:240]|nr:IMP dehydrogenase [Bacillota bacterium]CDB42961.1 inosine 5-monophosphate dehydrogenase [Firmicutes bacterium CAG:240]
MAIYFNEPSRTFSEYLLIPGYTSEECIPDNVSLRTPLVKFRKGEEPTLSLNVPFASAIMQSVSNDTMAIALAKEGGISFIYGSQSIEDEAAMVARVKSYKAGFVPSASNITPDATLKDVLELKERNGYSTMAVTEDGSATGKLLGIVSSRDYRVSRMELSTCVSEFMTPLEKLVTAPEGTSLKEANDIIWDHKLNSLPIVDAAGRLLYFVFRKDYAEHKNNPNEILDDHKRYVVGAGINSRDYAERVPALIEAGADVLCIDSSEGFSCWQKKTIDFIREKYGDSVKVGAGNVVDTDGFLFLAEAGADFVKVGIGGGSICITRETKGIGRGQATALIEVAAARDDYYKRTGVYIPICSDGGLVHDYHMTLALAMGADFLMMGRYFARFDESPTAKLIVNGSYVKEYWGEGSNRARNWQRYDLGGQSKLSFEEGVDSYVTYAGPLHDNLEKSVYKIKSTMCNCGVTNLADLKRDAKLTLVSSVSIVEGGSHDVILKNN